MAQKEEKRELTPAEEKRAERLKLISEELAGQGYTRIDRTIDLNKANTYIVLASIPVMILGVFLYIAVNGVEAVKGLIGPAMIYYLVGSVLLIVVHELVHGLTWSIFCKNGWRSIDFGFIVKTMNPYCTCCEPLEKGQYIAGALMPLLLVGIVPTVIAFITRSFWLLVLGLTLILGAGGDIMLVAELLRYKADGKEVLIYDHPTEAGSILFVR